MPENRQRSKRIQVRFSDEEFPIFQRNMEAAGFKQYEKYLRKLALYGAIYKVDFSDVKEHTIALNKIGTNINQIAKKGNEYRLNQTDLAEVKLLLQQLIQGEKAIIRMATDIHQMRNMSGNNNNSSDL